MAILLGSANGFDVYKSNVLQEVWSDLCAQFNAPPFFDTQYIRDVLSLQFSEYLYVCPSGKPDCLALLPLIDYSDSFLAPYLGFITSPPRKPSDSTRYQIAYELLCNTFLRMYDLPKAVLSSPPGTQDIRGLSWALEYGNHNISYKIEPRYTTVIDISSIELLFKNYRAVRRQEIRRFNTQNTYHFSLSSDSTACLDVYSRMFLDKSLPPSYPHLQRVSRFLGRTNNVSTFSLIGPNNVTVAFASFISSSHSPYAYYLVGAVDPSHRSANLMAPLLHNSFKELCRYTIRYVDLVGINSPFRGDFKSSFSGSDSIYFDFPVNKS